MLKCNIKGREVEHRNSVKVEDEMLCDIVDTGATELIITIQNYYNQFQENIQ
jgi:predicted aspartyl protease